MMLTKIRKILVILIIAAPLVSYTGCRKQAKCGCGKDVLYSLTNSISRVYFESGTNIWFQTISDPYSYYYFCNPTEMFKTMSGIKAGDEVLISGHVYWECSYLSQAGNSSYASYNKTYVVQVTDIHKDMYGK